MSLLVGCCGVSGSGKTTLCEAMASDKVVYLKTTISDIYKSASKHPTVRMTLSERLDVQQTILETLTAQWRDALERYENSDVIILSDRSPLDFIAYTMAEVSGYDEIDKALANRLLKYVDDCWRAAEMFSTHIHFPPGLPPVANLDGKVRAAQNKAYNLHYDTILLGLMPPGKIRLYGFDHDDRMRQLTRHFEDTSAFTI